VDYAVPLPAGAAGPYRVQAKLWYRIAFQEVLENIKEEEMGDPTGVIIPPMMIAEAQAASAPSARVAAAIARSRP
jgi:hypothetical protein